VSLQAQASHRPAGGYSCCPSEAERRDGGWRGSASAVVIEGERLTSRAMASAKIGHHSNLLTYRVPNSSMHWPPKKTNSPSMPIAARTVHLGHGMAMSRICAGNRSIFQHGAWVPRNRPPQNRILAHNQNHAGLPAWHSNSKSKDGLSAPVLGPFLLGRWLARERPRAGGCPRKSSE
jgi:hypothetical protein